MEKKVCTKVLTVISGWWKCDFSDSISTMHIYCFCYDKELYMFKKKERKKEAQETKKKTVKKTEKKGTSNNQTPSLSQGPLAKFCNQVCFLTMSQVTWSLNQGTEKVRFALNYQNMCPNLFFDLVCTDLPPQPDCLSLWKNISWETQLFIQCFWGVCKRSCEQSLVHFSKNWTKNK